MLGSAVKNKSPLPQGAVLFTDKAGCLLPWGEAAVHRERPWGSVCRLSSRQHAHPALKERPPAPLLLPCPEPWRTLPVCRGAAVPEPCRLGNPDAGPCSQFWRLEAHRQVPGGAVSGTPAARPVAVCLTDTASRASQITDSPAAKP
ncbi:uncharacterized protein LOC116657485 isoform X7 [Camelus ferus]|uniref:Uncharacterized protein LOC116657485 isoform X7 n=1 Tax=Camelus ferus TaxID=419612 RepID=A0A8B8RCI4_CAMFR|nr:uncharacterized protein LOC116657485 isoform X7 [Camelus ferus]